MKYEIHITVSLNSVNTIDKFERYCISKGYKPLIIQLPNGDYPIQPMISYVIDLDNMSDLYSKLDEIELGLNSNGFKPIRRKVEIPEYLYDLFIKENPDFKGLYFEWHGKINCDEFLANFLKEVCKSYNSHLSKNSLKNNPNERFITVRSYESRSVFRSHVHSVLNGIKKYVVPFKYQYEYCIIDSNINLDKGWTD